MRGRDRHLAARGFESLLEAVGQTLAVVVVGIGNRSFLDALFHHDFGHDDALTGIRGGSAEEQAVVFDGRQRGRGGRGREHHHPVRDTHVLQRRGGLTRALAADDAFDAIGRDQAVRRGGRSGRVGAAGVTAHGGHGRPTQQLARIRHFLDRQLGTRGHGRRHRFQRAGEGQQHADLDIFGRRSARHQRHACSGQQQFLHVYSP